MTDNHTIQDMETDPNSIFIGTVQTFYASTKLLRFKPVGYKVTISIAGYAIMQLVKRAIRDGYLILNGEIYYRGTNRMERITRSDRQEKA